MTIHLRPMEEPLRIPILGIEDVIIVPTVLADQFELKLELLDFVTGVKLMSKNTQEALTIIENKANVRTCRNKPHVSSSSGSSTQIDAITALTKQVKALISSMQEAYNRNQEAPIQLMQTQMGQIEEAFQERPLECSMPIDTPPSPYLVVLGVEMIDLLLRNDLETLSMGDRDIDFNPCRDIEELEHLLANEFIPFLRESEDSIISLNRSCDSSFTAVTGTLIDSDSYLGLDLGLSEIVAPLPSI
ncbi:hypothetical protein Tco_1038333 [Tanacetum coccineum]